MGLGHLPGGSGCHEEEDQVSQGGKRVDAQNLFSSRGFQTC